MTSYGRYWRAFPSPRQLGRVEIPCAACKLGSLRLGVHPLAESSLAAEKSPFHSLVTGRCSAALING